MTSGLHWKHGERLIMRQHLGHDDAETVDVGLRAARFLAALQSQNFRRRP